jgi:hypothetical protein
MAPGWMVVLGLALCALLFVLFGLLALLDEARKWTMDMATPAGRARRRAAAESRQGDDECRRQERRDELARPIRERVESRQRAHAEWQPKYDALMSALVSEWIDKHDPNLELREVPAPVLDEMGRQVEAEIGPDPRWA